MLPKVYRMSPKVHLMYTNLFFSLGFCCIRHGAGTYRRESSSTYSRGSRTSAIRARYSRGTNVEAMPRSKWKRDLIPSCPGASRFTSRVAHVGR